MSEKERNWRSENEMYTVIEFDTWSESRVDLDSSIFMASQAFKSRKRWTWKECAELKSGRTICLPIFAKNWMNEPETLTLNMHSYSTVHFKCVEKAVLNARQFMSVVDCAVCWNNPAKKPDLLHIDDKTNKKRRNMAHRR